MSLAHNSLRRNNVFRGQRVITFREICFENSARSNELRRPHACEDHDDPRETRFEESHRDELQPEVYFISVTRFSKDHHGPGNERFSRFAQLLRSDVAAKTYRFIIPIEKGQESRARAA